MRRPPIRRLVLRSPNKPYDVKAGRGWFQPSAPRLHVFSGQNSSVVFNRSRISLTSLDWIW